MTCTKGERLDAIMKRLACAAPFSDFAHARMALETIMRQVEDEMSGIEENSDPVRSDPDGRMYPPHDKFEKDTNCPQVRWFRQARHSTFIGVNGALKIISVDGEIAIDLRGKNGMSISQLMEKSDERR